MSQSLAQNRTFLKMAKLPVFQGPSMGSNTDYAKLQADAPGRPQRFRDHYRSRPRPRATPETQCREVTPNKDLFRPNCKTASSEIRPTILQSFFLKYSCYLTRFYIFNFYLFRLSYPLRRETLHWRPYWLFLSCAFLKQVLGFFSFFPWFSLVLVDSNISISSSFLLVKRLVLS